MDSKEIGKQLQKRRKNLDITQVELSNILGVTHQAISRWETGESIPDIQMLVELSKLYSITIDEIINPNPIVSSIKEDDTIDDRVEEKVPYDLFSYISIFLSVIGSIFLMLSITRIDSWRVGFFIVYIIFMAAAYLLNIVGYYLSDKNEDDIRRNALATTIFGSIIYGIFAYFVILYVQMVIISIPILILYGTVIYRILFRFHAKSKGYSPVFEFEKGDVYLVIFLILLGVSTLFVMDTAIPRFMMEYNEYYDNDYINAAFFGTILYLGIIMYSNKILNIDILRYEIYVLTYFTTTLFMFGMSSSIGQNYISDFFMNQTTIMIWNLIGVAIIIVGVIKLVKTFLDKSSINLGMLLSFSMLILIIAILSSDITTAQMNTFDEINNYEYKYYQLTFQNTNLISMYFTLLAGVIPMFGIVYFRFINTNENSTIL